MPKSGVDYADYNITVYRLCHYGCRYCWAWRLPLFKQRISKGSYDPIEEAKRIATHVYGKVIVVSFTSDPYPPEEAGLRKTRAVLEALRHNPTNIVLVLTKNPALAVRLDLPILGEHIWLGTTITSLAPNKLEPYAPHPWERLMALWVASRYNVRTWVSIEPVIPGITLPEDIVRETARFVDWYVFGSFNYVKTLGFSYSPHELKGWYKEHIFKAIEACEEEGKPYYVKKELRKLIPELPKGKKPWDLEL